MSYNYHDSIVERVLDNAIKREIRALRSDARKMAFEMLVIGYCAGLMTMALITYLIK